MLSHVCVRDPKKGHLIHQYFFWLTCGEGTRKGRERRQQRCRDHSVWDEQGPAIRRDGVEWWMRGGLRNITPSGVHTLRFQQLRCTLKYLWMKEKFSKILKKRASVCVCEREERVLVGIKRGPLRAWCSQFPPSKPAPDHHRSALNLTPSGRDEFACTSPPTIVSLRFPVDAT